MRRHQKLSLLGELEGTKGGQPALVWTPLWMGQAGPSLSSQVPTPGQAHSRGLSSSGWPLVRFGPPPPFAVIPST